MGGAGIAGGEMTGAAGVVAVEKRGDKWRRLGFSKKTSHKQVSIKAFRLSRKTSQ